MENNTKKHQSRDSWPHFYHGVFGDEKAFRPIAGNTSLPKHKTNQSKKKKIHWNRIIYFYIFPKYQWCTDIRCMPNQTITVYFRVITDLFLPEYLTTVLIFLICYFFVKEWQCILDYTFICLFVFVAHKSRIHWYFFNGNSSPVCILTLLLK